MMKTRKFFKFFLTLSILESFTACRTAKVIEQVPVYVHDTAYIAKEVHDSIHIDRWHTEYQKGDTIYITEEVTKFELVTKTDTAYQVIERPITVTQMKTVEVEKRIAWWQKSLMWLGVACIICFIGWVVWKTRSWWNKRL